MKEFKNEEEKAAFIAEKKAKKQETLQVNPTTRKSFLGKRYKHSVESDWTSIEGHWVHNAEAHEFSLHFGRCSKTNELTKRTDLRKLMDGDTVSLDWATKNNYVLCEHTSRMVPAASTTKVFSNSGTEITIHIKFLDAYFKCSALNKLFPLYGAINIKSSTKYSKVSRYAIETTGWFRSCDDCGGWFEADKVKHYSDLGNICDTCYAKHKFTNVIHAWNDKTFPSPMYTPSMRYGHKVSKDGLICATGKQEMVKAVRLFGAEAEVELHKPSAVAKGLTRHAFAYFVRQALGSDFCAIKEDGTLTLNGKYSGDSKFDPDGTKDGPSYAGFEIVTAPADLATHRSRWPLLEKCAELHDSKGDRMLRAWDTDTCGFHVHVSRASLNSLQIGRMLRFVNHKKNAKFIHKIAGRGSDTYCRYLDKEFVDVLHPDRVISPEEKETYNRKRRVALNISNEATVEFRIFRGTIHPSHIIRNIEFVDAVCDFCYPASRSLTDMDDYGKFVYFVSKNRKAYPELAAWFVTQKQIVLKKIGEGADPRKFTLHPDMIAEVEHKPNPSEQPKKKSDDTF